MRLPCVVQSAMHFVLAVATYMSVVLCVSDIMLFPRKRYENSAMCIVPSALCSDKKHHPLEVFGFLSLHLEGAALLLKYFPKIMLVVDFVRKATRHRDITTRRIDHKKHTTTIESSLGHRCSCDSVCDGAENPFHPLPPPPNLLITRRVVL